jgi:ribosomal protein S18 acetylase RimI-like enzyme
MPVIEPSVAHIPLLQQLMRTTFTSTFGHLYPAADLAHYLDTAYATGQLAAEIADPHNFWRLVLDDNSGEAVAYLECLPAHLPHHDVRPTHGEIERIYVRPDQQGKGLGKVLMQVALDHFAERYGDAPQWLGVWSENHKAQAFYRTYGFDKAGEYEFPVGETRDREFIFRRLP